MKFTLGLSCCLLLTLMSRQAEAQAPDFLCRNDHRYVDDHIYPDDWHLIVDSYDYEDLFEGSRAVWELNDVDGDGQGWNDGFGGTCQLEIGVGSCSVGTTPDNWFFTDHNSYGRAIEVFINATFRWTSCSNCGVDVYRYDTNTSVSETQQVNTNNYNLVTGSDSSSSLQHGGVVGDSAVILEFTRPKRFSGLYLGFRNTEVCGGQIKRFLAYYKICVPSSLTTGRPLVRFQEVALPEKNSALPNNQSATCTENAIPVVASMNVSAYGNGTCDTNAQCACRGGYRVNNTVECVACPAGTYREFQSSTEGCTSCPANSEAQMEGSPQCNCTDGYYRAPGEPVSKECTEPPSRPTSVAIPSIGNDSVSISWSIPTSNGGRNDITYNVEYEEVGSLDGFVRSNTVPITGTSFTVRGLRPVTTYIVRVIAENGVSSFEPGQIGLTRRAAELTFTTGEGVPGCPSKFDVIDNIIALWQPPEVPNGNISGYQISIGYSDPKKGNKKQMNSLEFNSSSFFYVIRKRDIPENISVTMQIRANTSAGYGEWCHSQNFVPFGTITCDDVKGSCALGDIVPQLAITAVITLFLTALIMIVIVIAIVACCKCCLNSGDNYRSGGDKKRKTDFDLDNPSFSKNGY